MSKFKSIIVILLSVFLCLALISCGGSEGHLDETQPSLEPIVQQEGVKGSHDIKSPGEETRPESTISPEEQLDGAEEPSKAPPDNSEIILPETSTFSIKFIDVGQADAALIECDGHYMLIDGGNKADSNLIYSVLKKANISHLDIVVGTYAHEDHIGGLPGAFNYADADITL